MADNAQTGTTEAYEWHGRRVIDADGDKIGTIEEIYLNDASAQPEWALVGTGLTGSNSNFMPLGSAVASGEDIQVAISADKVKNAPSIEHDGPLSAEQVQELYAYYGDHGSEVQETEAAGQDTSGPTTDDAMTRSEEEVAVGTRQREAGRVRLRKYVVTENVQVTVPVQREKVRIEREPITEGNAPAAMDGPAISEEVHEMTLHEEEPVVEKRVVPKERVRLVKETVVDETQVSEEVRKEQIDVEGER